MICLKHTCLLIKTLVSFSENTRVFLSPSANALFIGLAEGYFLTFFTSSEDLL